MFESIKLHFKAFSFLSNNGLTWLLWFPTIITLLVLLGGMSLTSWATDAIMTMLTEAIGKFDWLGDWAGFIGTLLYWFLWLALRIALYFALAFVGGSIILLLMSPILTYVSEKVATAVGGKTVDFNLTQFFRDLTRAIGVALRNGGIQLGITIACFLIGFIPVVGIISPIILFVSSAYFYGFSFMDYTFERQQISVSESSRFAWKSRSTTLGLGTPFALWMLIPFFGPITSGYVALIATVAATIQSEQKFNKALANQ